MITEKNNCLLTEVECQEKYLARPLDDFSFPPFNASQALESQPYSSYRKIAAAAREIVDNAIQAKATRVDICLEHRKRLRPHRRADFIHSMAFIDIGSVTRPGAVRRNP